LEKAFFNPTAMLILTEQEATYNASLIKRRETSANQNIQETIEDFNDEKLKDIHLRAHNTVELLS